MNMEEKAYRPTRYACFLTSFSTAATGNLSPLLFLTFRNFYHLSYSMLGLLVAVNFGTQLLFDLLFTVYSSRLPLKKCVKIMPAVMGAGFVLYGLAPWLMPGREFLCLTIGTVIFSIGNGLSEVLTSPTVAALPDKNPDRLMARLHSCYAWGVVAVVFIVTLFLKLLGAENWPVLAFLFALPPLCATLLFLFSPIPDIEGNKDEKPNLGIFKNKTLWLCCICIFLGGAAECTMSQWCSGYVEQALGLDKVWGDVFGLALFGGVLGLGRSLYAHRGKTISGILIWGSAGAAVCYLMAVFSPNAVLSLIACALTGFCVSMLWPGSLIRTAELVPRGGVSMYAFMAAGGDLGAALVPQLVGILSDGVLASPGLLSVAQTLSLTADSFALRCGMVAGALFPIAGIFCFIRLKKKKSPGDAD